MCVGCGELSEEEAVFALLNLVRRAGGDWVCMAGRLLKVKDEVQDEVASFCSTSGPWDNSRQKQ